MWNREHAVGGLVLAGAVAKGAFEAGVTRELAERGFRFDRFVGTSAGALNATILAAGAAAGKSLEAARLLEELWRESGSLSSFLSPTFAFARGLSTTQTLSKLVQSALAKLAETPRTEAPIRTSLQLITTNLRGALDAGELTHEDRYAFSEQDLLDPAQWPALAAVASASAALPGLFAPPVFADGGQRVDGGAVNNAPLSCVMDDEREINHIVVVSAELPTVPREPPLGGTRLLSRLIQVLINERIGRDLKVAKKRNERRAELLTTLRESGVNEEGARALADKFGFRQLDVLPIRPQEALEGGAFGGFVWKPYRMAQLAAGRKAASRELERQA